MIGKLSLRLLFTLLFIATCNMMGVLASSGAESSKSVSIDAPVRGGGDDFVTFYHGTSKSGAANIRANGIDLSYSRARTDFGRGFYTTTSQLQAQKWAARHGGEVLEFRVSRQALESLNSLNLATKTQSSLFRFFRHNRLGGRLHSRDLCFWADVRQPPCIPPRNWRACVWATDILPHAGRPRTAIQRPTTMTRFTFKTDSESAQYCEGILAEMTALFSISADEALGRMNRTWDGQEILGDDDPIYHEDEEYWANTIYYGKDSNWWMNPEGLKPLPYP